jgi:HK97 family phage portal protein
MNTGTLLSKIGAFMARAVEGAYRPGPYLINYGNPSGWLPDGAPINFWQCGIDPRALSGSSAMVEACVSAYAQTIAACPGDHWVSSPNGGRERVTTSALSRIIRRPNDYSSMSDLLLNLTRRLYTRGEAFGLAIRNNRFEISELHWMREGFAMVAEDGSIFYSLTGNEIVQRRFDMLNPIPARDVLHIRLHTPRHSLKGESPITAAALELEMQGAALSQQGAFYLNQARPSFVLETDEKITVAKAGELRELWNAQTRGEHAGGTPILSWGLKAKPITIGASDGQLAQMLEMTDQHIALAFRMPLQILGIGGTPFASTEALMSSWKATGLGFALNHIEEGFGMLFGLAGYPAEYIEFDTEALLRSSFKEMIDALTTGTRRLMTINEARRHIDLPAKDGADTILVQQQDIPIDMAGKIAKPPKPAGADGTTDGAADGADTTDAEQGAAKDYERMRNRFRSSHARRALAA